MAARRPTVAVWKFASCDGCQLSLLDCEQELLAVADRVDLRWFLEAGLDDGGTGTYDLSLVEGSVTTAGDAERIRDVRRRSRTLVTIGACATAGGIQALRNLADVDEYRRLVYASPEYIDVLGTSTAISAHVAVDFELRGCPIDRRQLLEVVAAFANGRRPAVAPHSVCLECKARGTVCVMVARGEPCLGPVTHAGCGALCPSYHRGCYGCFGPDESPEVDGLAAHLEATGAARVDLVRSLRTFNAAAPAFARTSAALAGDATAGDARPQEQEEGT